jgi:hypothetical protein
MSPNRRGLSVSPDEGATADVVAWLMLTVFIWAAGFLVPRATRERNRFGLICSLMTALIALASWLLIGAGVRSA